MLTIPRGAAENHVPPISRFLTAATAAVVFVAFFLVASSARPVQAQAVGSPNLVVSQFYTRGGEAGAAHPVDFIEIFNRGRDTVDLTKYSIQVTTTNGNTTTTVMITFVSSQGGIAMQPGQYRTIEFSVIVLPPPFPSPTTLGPTGKIAIVRNKDPLPAVQCPLGQDPDIEDYVGYGAAANCFEGTGPAPTPTLTLATYRASNGCTDTDNNAADFSLAGAPNPRDSTTGGTPHSPCPLAPGTSTFQFNTSFIITSENVPSVDVTVTRTGGDISTPATVDYATSDGTAGGAASERKDYTTALGTLRFAANETSKTFTVLLNEDAFIESGGEFFDISLSNPTGLTALADPSTLRVTINDNDSTQQPNPVDQSPFFVMQQYHDFLNRNADQAGLDFWVNQIESCGADAQCREVKRINTSAAFFLSIEFQQTGYLVHRFYRASYPNTVARPRGLPRYREFIRDTQEIGRGVVIGQPGANDLLEANKVAFANLFVARTEFIARYPVSQTPAQYVDALNANAGGVLSQAERDELITGLTNGTQTRATALRRVADDVDFFRAEYNAAFVLMQYIGYLRRNPNDTPNTDYSGYDFWLGKMNQFSLPGEDVSDESVALGRVQRAEMVKAFITSGEYRQRFGQ